METTDPGNFIVNKHHQQRNTNIILNNHLQSTNTNKPL